MARYRLGMLCLCSLLLAGFHWSPVGAAVRHALIYSHAGSLLLLDVETAQMLTLAAYEPDACPPRWSLDGSSVVLFGETPVVLDTRSGEVVPLQPTIVLDTNYCNMLLSADGSQMTTLVNQGATLLIHFADLDTANSRQLTIDQRIFDAPAQPPGEYWYAATWSPDGQRMTYLQCFDTTHCYHHVIDAASGELLYRLPANYSFNAAAWSPDGRWFIAGTDSAFILYDAVSWQEQQRFDTPDAYWLVVSRVSASASGRYLAGGHRRWRVSLYDDAARYLGVQLYDTETTSLLQVPGAENSCCAAWSTSGALLAYHPITGGINVFDAQTVTLREFTLPIDPLPLIWWTTLE